MGVTEAPLRVDERLVAWIWQHQRIKGPLHCSDGRAIQVVYPGRTWGEGRPDFQGALIAFEPGGLQRGDVEIHVRQRDWRQHGHHRDPGYDDVILHVVFHPTSVGETVAASGQAVPTIALEPVLAQPVELLAMELQADRQSRGPACQDDPMAVSTLLEQAGRARFLSKAARFEGDLTVLPPAEVLWRGVARALGYTANAAPMERLAGHVPLSAVRDLLLLEMPAGDRHVTALAALLGSAGLLPSQRQLWSVDRLGATLEGRWRWLQTYGWRAALATEDWELGRVRPANNPVRRLAGLACLAIDWLSRDPTQTLAQAVLDSDGRSAPLIGRFTIQAPERGWAALLDLAGALEPPRSALVGRSRALEIVANVALPVAYALGAVWNLDDLSAAALRLYGRLPKSAENGLARHMGLQLVGSGYRQVVTSTMRQQGLLHLFRSSCEEHACERCPGRPLHLAPRRHPTA